MGSGRQATSSSSGGTGIVAEMATCSSPSSLSSILVELVIMDGDDDDDGPESIFFSSTSFSFCIVLAFSFILFILISPPSPPVGLVKSRPASRVDFSQQFLRLRLLCLPDPHSFENGSFIPTGGGGIPFLEGSVPFPTPPTLPLVMGGDGSLGEGVGIVPAAEAECLARDFIILEELGRETWTEFL